MASTVDLTLFPTPNRPHGYSPALALWLYWDDGQLRFYDPATGEWLRSRTEERAARQLAEAQVAELQAELRRLRSESA